MELKDVKIIKVGASFGFTVPKTFIDNGLLKFGDKYNITITPKTV